MPEKQDTTFADGLFFNFPPEKAPSFIIGKLSINVDEFKVFLDANVDAKGYVNIDLKESKGGKGYAVLDTWKPTKKVEPKEVKDVPDNLHVPSKGIEYPEEEVNPEDIPF